LTFRELLDDRLGIAGEVDEAQGVRRTDLEAESSSQETVA